MVSGIDEKAVFACCIIVDRILRAPLPLNFTLSHLSLSHFALFSRLLLSTGLPSDIAHFLAYGADRVLLKPLDINAFSNAIHDMEDDDLSI